MAGFWNFLLAAHVDHDFFGLVLVVELIHELLCFRHMQPPPAEHSKANMARYVAV